MSRVVTQKVRDAIDNGALSWEDVGKAALNYLSEQQVAEMAWSEWNIDEDTGEDEEDEPLEDDEPPEDDDGYIDGFFD